MKGKRQRSYWELVFFKALAELKAESKRTYLSFLWWILDPLMTMAIFYLVFGVFLQHRRPDFVPFLLIGITIWNGFANPIRHGSSALFQNLPLMQQTYLPKWVFPMVVVVMDWLKFSIVLGLLLIFLWSYGFRWTSTHLALFPLLGLLLMLTTSIALLVAAFVPFLPDLRFLIDNFLHLLFFLSGIFYSPDMLRPEHREILYLNPVAVLVESFRRVLMAGEWPNWERLLPVAFESSFLLLLAWSLLRRWDRLYPKIITQ